MTTLSTKKTISIVWLKRDLRLVDHEPLLAASQAGRPILLLYVFEPMLIADPHYDLRHWRFVWQSLMDMRKQLLPFGGDVHISTESLSQTLKRIQHEFTIKEIFSHQEIGLDITFKRDQRLQQWCHHNQVQWHQPPSGAVIRGLSNRLHWDQAWNKTMRAEIHAIDLSRVHWQTFEDLIDDNLTAQWQLNDPQFQLGGSTAAQLCLDSFFTERGQDYHKLISKPQASRSSCSRMSTYLAWGNISLRDMYQQLLKHWNRPYWRRALVGLSSRLHWHCHFIQKFESESRMEFEALNRGYEAIPYRQGKAANVDLLKWKTGQTGYPLVDACMRCLQQTGYINFRMRAMLVSFLCHNLHLDWRRGVRHLARLFLDFEPGIHYSQFQMQAGLMGVNTVRIYNATKQAKDHDPNGQFIKKWVPELKPLPDTQVHEPWLITALEEQLYGFVLERDYHSPCVDLQTTAKTARTLLYGWRKKPEIQAEIKRILAQHVRAKSR